MYFRNYKSKFQTNLIKIEQSGSSNSTIIDPEINFDQKINLNQEVIDQLIPDPNSTSNPKFISKLFDLLNHEESMIRRNTALLITQNYSSNVNLIKINIKNHFINLYNKKSIEESINVLIYAIVSGAYSNLESIKLILYECIFPLFKYDLNEYEDPLIRLFNTIANYGNEIILFSIKNLVLKYKCASTQNKELFYLIINQMIKSNSGSKGINTCILLNNPLNTLIINSLLNENIFELERLTQFLSTYPEILKKLDLKNIFNAFFKLNSSFWNRKKSSDLIKLMDIFMKSNPMLYNECERKYKFEEIRMQMQNEGYGERKRKKFD